MKTDYSHVSLLDIVFENRNKAYGAYQLRSTYHHTMQRAMAITFGNVLALLLFKLLHDKLHRPTVAKATEIISNLTAPVLLQQQEVMIKEPEKAPAAQAASAFLTHLLFNRNNTPRVSKNLKALSPNRYLCVKIAIFNTKSSFLNTSASFLNALGSFLSAPL